jgi:uncharacterized integral membrane protein
MASDQGPKPPDSGAKSPLDRLGGKGLAVIGLGLLALVFIGENTHRTKVRFIIPQLSAPLWLALLLAAGVGAVAGGLFVHRRSK